MREETRSVATPHLSRYAVPGRSPEFGELCADKPASQTYGWNVESLTMDDNRASHTTRREFLRKSGKAVAGAALVSAVARPGHTAEDNTIRLALVGCGGRGTGAAANAMATRSGPIKLVAMADVFQDRMSRSYEALKSAATRVEGSADAWVMGFEPAQVDVPPERRFLGFDAYQKAMDCLKPGDVVILTTPVAFRWVHFTYAIAKGLNVFMEKPISVDGPTTRKMIATGARRPRRRTSRSASA